LEATFQDLANPMSDALELRLPARLSALEGLRVLMFRLMKLAAPSTPSMLHVPADLFVSEAGRKDNPR